MFQLKCRPALDYTCENRFGSYAPPRDGVAKWFVDGEGYMQAVAAAISKVSCHQGY